LVSNLKEDEKRLWKKYRKTKDAGLRNFLIEKYLPNVKYIAERLQAKLPQTVEVDDLMSAGTFGLMQAIEGFDYERGIKFETYCANRIRGSILDELRNLDWVPRLVRTKAHKITNAYRDMEVLLGRAPSDAELAERMELSLDEYDDMCREASAITLVSLSEKASHGDDDKILKKIDVLENKQDADPSQDLEKRELVELVTKGLSRKERLILVLYYYERLTMREIGEIIDLSESRVCQIHSKIIMRLKSQLCSMKNELLA
jgi:RNA polymerase sigma factor FliA